jgi:hypothetical protein
MIRGHRVRIVTVLSVAAATAAASMAALPDAQAATTPGWRLVSAIHQGPAADINGLSSVVAVIRRNAWAFGGTDVALPQGGKPTAEHWNGHWRAAALPAGLAGPLGAASAPSRNDIWVVSQLNGYVLHYNGAAWSVAKKLPEPEGSLPKQLTGVTAFSPTNVWVFGAPGADPGQGTWHLHGRTWSRVTGVGGGIATASALSPSNIWAVGANDVAPQDVVVHYNGSTWKQVRSLTPGSGAFGDVVALSPSSVWVSGTTFTASGNVPWMLHYNGKKWTKYKVPFALNLAAIAADGSGGIWITASSTTTGDWYALHRSSSGAWRRYLITTTGQVSGLGLIPGTTSMWAAGATSGLTGAKGAVWAYGAVG